MMFSFSALLRRSIPVLYLNRLEHTSALYIPGSKGIDRTFLVRPDLDFTKTFRDLPKLRKNLKLRGIKINVDNLRARYNEIDAISTQLDELKLKKTDAINMLKALKAGKREEELQTKEEQFNYIRKEYQQLNAKWHEYEENVILQLLKLPNDIHPDTPEDEELEIKRCGEPFNGTSQSHIETYKQQNLVKFVDGYCYLEDDLSAIEHDLLSYFVNIMKEAYFIEMSNPDFVKSVIVEGCGKSLQDTNAALCLESHHDIGSLESCNASYLVGSNSLEAYVSYFARTIIDSPDVMPISLFSVGRSYNTAAKDSRTDSLFNMCQESTVDAFIGCEDEHELEYFAEELVDIICKACEDFGFLFRVVRVPAHRLSLAENSRTAIQMFSPASQEWIDVSFISCYGDWISRRMMIEYYIDDTRLCKAYLQFVHARVISVTKLLGILGEIPELKPKIT